MNERLDRTDLSVERPFDEHLSTPVAIGEFDRSAFGENYNEFLRSVPNILKAVTPSQESKNRATEGVVSGLKRSFHCRYPSLEALDDEKIASVNDKADQLLAMVAYLPEPERTVYHDSIKEACVKCDLVVAMRDYNAASNDESKQQAAERFMRANIDLYGEPDKDTYLSLLSEKIACIAAKKRSPEAEHIFQELRNLLPEEVISDTPLVERFRPSAETIEWMHTVVNELFGNLLSHVPDTDEKITPTQLQEIFQEIVDEEFVFEQEEDEGEEAKPWTVKLANVSVISINVKGRRILIPVDRQPLAIDEVRRLVVHEIGVHMMTAVAGESTDIKPLATGLAGYEDTQEGLGKIAEQALEGQFKEAGVDHYITAGLAYFDGRDFCDTHEVKWRMKLLEDLQPGEVPTAGQIAQTKKSVISGPIVTITRIYRGTDELPLFKNLNYYNGAIEVWKYLESICGDDLQLSLLFAGKVDTSKENQRVVLESRSVYGKKDKGEKG